MRMQAHVGNGLKPAWLTASHPGQPRPATLNVLIADDHAGSRLGFRVALEAAGYGVAEAEDGEQALEFLRRDAVDLALLDLRLPRLDGMEVLRRIRDEAIDIPVVVITAHGSVSCALRAMELGAIDFLAKPVEPLILRETVVKVLLRLGDSRTESYRPAPNSLGGAAQKFADSLNVARRALQHGHFELTEYLVQQALDLDPDSAEANALRGALQERLGEYHAAYRSYRWALIHDPHHGPARDGINRYCERFGLDPGNQAINPVEAEGSSTRRTLRERIRGLAPWLLAVGKPIRMRRILKPVDTDYSKDGKTCP